MSADGARDGIIIAPAAGADEIASVKRLFLEYAQALEFDLDFQDFDGELAGLPGAYAPPAGRLLLARAGGEVAGCVALRPLTDGRCEMKRLYVRPACRGRALGRRLAEAAIAAAREAGYAALRLDTHEATMGAAQALYRDLGFVEIPPYYPSPAEQLRYFELSLE